MSDHTSMLGVQLSRLALQAKLIRNGKTWKIPIDDTHTALLWRLVDDLFPGDLVQFPETSKCRPIRMTVSMPDSNETDPSFFLSLRSYSYGYFLMSHLECPECNERSQMDIRVVSIVWARSGYPDAVFARPCPCGHEILQDGKTTRGDWW